MQNGMGVACSVAKCSVSFYDQMCLPDGVALNHCVDEVLYIFVMGILCHMWSGGGPSSVTCHMAMGEWCCCRD